MRRMMNIVRLAALLLVVSLVCPWAQAEEGHFLLSEKDCGVCKRLTGKVELEAVLVSLAEAPWTAESRQALEASFNQAMDTLEREAAAYGAYLDLSVKYHAVSAEETISLNGDSNDWVEGILDGDPALPAYDRTGVWDSRPLLLCINTGGRAFANSRWTEDTAEYLILFGTGVERTICHELMHLYGAWDYYLHDEVKAAAQQYSPDSIMLSSRNGNVVDSLTAYVIGWTDTLDANARALLDATAHLTQDDIWLALAQNTQDGLCIEQEEGYVYTGLLQSGLHHGWGVTHWTSGEYYAGGWEWGRRSGQGVYRWEDGTCYVGDFVDGERHGRGTMLWESGSVYTGEFVHGEREGQGTMRWSDGSVYIGEFVQGEQNGQGTMIWANGSIYTGEFLDGKYHGQGTLNKSNGAVYTGSFRDNIFSGQGLYVWPDGSYYNGAWQDGTYHGYGVYCSADGTVMEGNWDNGRYLGK